MLPHVLTRQRQDKPIPWTLQAYNLNFAHLNETKLVEIKAGSIIFKTTQVSNKSNKIFIFSELLHFSAQICPLSDSLE